MATAVLNPDPQKFPAGTTVKAYKRSTQPAVWDRSGAPQGTQDASATVATDGSVTFTGLTDGTEYLLYAASPDRWASFTTPAAPAAGSESPLAATVISAAAVAAPAAFSSVVAPQVTVAGIYAVEVTTFQVGTVDTNRANMSLVAGGSNVGPLLSTGQPTKVSLPWVNLAANDFLAVQIGAAAGGAGSVYCAQIVLTRVKVS